MSMTGLDVFDRAIHKANDWLKDLMFELNWEDRHKAYLGLRATLHALRDRLLPEEAVQLGAQLPLLIRGFYYDGWTPSGKPLKERRKEEFLGHIKDQFRGDDVDPEAVARAVFKLLAHRISKGEIEDIRGVLPREIADLWPHAPGK
jgi:uncharacterized protein (DUF2267 family)